mmetsp:Transcript_16939/g.40246  ORF Transcript_16939/g.40246 Transcript_16939/m.40246 type:complete len:129 (-) Transcript_16939:71-457(-)
MLLLGVLGLLAVAIGAAHGLAVLIVAVVHGLALVVERVAKEVEFARLLMLRAVEAEAGRALQHGVGARRAHDREEGDTRTSRIVGLTASSTFLARECAVLVTRRIDQGPTNSGALSAKSIQLRSQERS